MEFTQSDTEVDHLKLPLCDLQVDLEPLCILNVSDGGPAAAAGSLLRGSAERGWLATDPQCAAVAEGAGPQRCSDGAEGQDLSAGQGLQGAGEELHHGVESAGGEGPAVCVPGQKDEEARVPEPVDHPHQRGCAWYVEYRAVLVCQFAP